MIKIAIEPKSKGDLEKMSNGLIKLAQEDPSFNFSRDEETNQTVIEGMGELHLDIIVDRLRREFKVRRRGRCLSGGGEGQAHFEAHPLSQDAIGVVPRSFCSMYVTAQACR